MHALRSLRVAAARRSVLVSSVASFSPRAEKKTLANAATQNVRLAGDSTRPCSFFASLYLSLSLSLSTELRGRPLCVCRLATFHASVGPPVACAANGGASFVLTPRRRSTRPCVERIRSPVFSVPCALEIISRGTTPAEAASSPLGEKRANFSRAASTRGGAAIARS